LWVKEKHLQLGAIEVRKATVASILRKSRPGIRLNAHLTHPGDIVFAHACKMGLEGIVSKRLGSRYRSGRTSDWLKFKNPEAPAVKREAEEVGQVNFLRRIVRRSPKQWLAQLVGDRLGQ
jgi:ATP-dependent DNA ligase